MHSSRKMVRRSSGSSRIIRTEGRSIAITRPGSPAPEPTSTTSVSSGINSTTTAQFQQVPVPQAGNLTRTEQATLHAIGGQQVGKPGRQRKP